uniref:SET domain-containing protein n=1 Tax=Magallana gigas TaxID=29159 RepID=A0A8W8II90_MAGGI
MSRKDRKRVIIPVKIESRKWSEKNIDPPGFNISLFENKGRGVRATFAEMQATFYLIVYRDLCVDASEEDGRLGRLVNHGSKKEINCKMKLIGEVLCLFGTRDIYEGEELLYDYGLKFYPWNSKTNHLPLRDHSVCPISLLHLLT